MTSSQDFDAYAQSYGETVQGSIQGYGAELDYFTRRKADLLIGMVQRLAGPPDQLDFLDVGCGVGNTDRHLVERVGSLLGVDPAAEALREASVRNPTATYRQTVDGVLPVADESTDISFAINVMHHVEPAERPAFVRELHRVTRPRGLVVVFEHNPFNPLTKLSVMRCTFDEGVVLQSRRTSSRLLAEAGLEPVARGYVIFSPFDWPWTIPIEARLAWLPAGAQHYVAARRSPNC